jgi:hypothetical protein
MRAARVASRCFFAGRARLQAQRLLSGSPGQQVVATDVFVTLLAKPMRSAAVEELEELAVLPRDHTTFFAQRSPSLSAYMLLFRVHALHCDGEGALRSLELLKVMITSALC